MCFNTIKDDIELKHALLQAPIPPSFNTIKDDIELKPQIRLNLCTYTIE